MPAIPPIAVKIIEVTDSRLPPQSNGTKLPTVVPMSVAAMMICLLFMKKINQRVACTERSAWHQLECR